MSIDLSSFRDVILATARKHGAREVSVFGSLARSESSADSDLDLLVRFEEGRSLLDRVAMIQDLEDVLGIDVDVVTEKALHPLIREQVLIEAIRL